MDDKVSSIGMEDSFKDHMASLASKLKEDGSGVDKLALLAINLEHAQRFGNRDDIPEKLVAEALKHTKKDA